MVYLIVCPLFQVKSVLRTIPDIEKVPHVVVHFFKHKVFVEVRLFI